MSEEIKRMDIKEFREEGFLQEVNRKFFHPLGLALEVIVEEDGSVKLGGIWDYRDDPEGMFYNPRAIIDDLKVNTIEALRLSKVKARLGSDVVVDDDGIQVT